MSVWLVADVAKCRCDGVAVVAAVLDCRDGVDSRRVDGSVIGVVGQDV